MKLTYRYEVKTTFDPAIYDHYLDFRCIPMNNALQQVYGSHVTVSGADYIRKSFDGAGNALVSVRISGPHTETLMVSEGIVFVDVNALEKEALPFGFETQTPYTQPDEAMTCYFHDSLLPLLSDSMTGWEKVKAVMHRLYQDMRYKQGVTDFHTKAGEAFSHREGVCQDYAQILMGFVRLMGIPCRYVAGFLVGEGASHAWVEIYDRGYWYGFDPTHDRTISDHYIKLAHGRDACDCPLDRGVYRGIARESCMVKVTVREIV